MARRKSEKTQRRDKLLEIFQQLDIVGQRFTLQYAEKLLEIQEMEALVNRVKEIQATGDEACSFCGKSREEVGYLMAGPGSVYICDDCVKICAELMEKEKGAVAHDERS